MRVIGFALLLALSESLLAGVAESPDPVGDKPRLLTKAEQVRQLSTEQARRGWPVRLRCVVTYSDPDWGMLFCQDETGGIYIYQATVDRSLRLGLLVDLEGASQPGEFAPVVAMSRATVLGPGETPRPRPISAVDLMSGSQDSQWVECGGIVRTVREESGHQILEVASEGRRFRVYFPAILAPALRERLVDAKVSFHGVYSASRSSAGKFTGSQFFVPGEECIAVVEPAPSDPFALPVRSITSLMAFDARSDTGHRVRVRGVVTLHRPGLCVFLHDSSDSMYVTTRRLERLEPGAEVDAVGFPTKGGFTRRLEDAILRVSGKSDPPAPLVLDAVEVLSRAPDAELIQVEGRLLDQRRSMGELLLAMQEGYSTFHAHIEESIADGLSRSLAAGSRLRLTGVCSIQADELSQPQSFRVLLRSPADVVVLERPSWWTAKRILAALALVAVAAIAVVGWNFTLRTRAREQTTRIRQQVEREAALETRCRQLIEDANDIVYSHDLEGDFTSFNRAAEIVTGYAGSEARRMNIAQVVAPEHLQAAREMIRRKMAGEASTVYELEVVTKDGRRVTLEVNTRLVRRDGQPVGVEGIARDITERRRAELALRRRDAVLGAVGLAAEQILRGAKWQRSAPTLLEGLGRAVGISRAYVFEIHVAGNGEALVSQRYEWAAQGCTSQIDNPQLQNFPFRTGGFARWEEILSAKGIVSGLARDFPPCERPLLEAQNIQSILIVPVFAGQNLWGFMGFDDCLTEREWSPLEVEGLRMAASILGGAIHRERSDSLIEESVSLLRATLESTADGILVVDREGRIVSYNRRFQELWRIPENVLSSHDDSQALKYVLEQLANPEQFLARVQALYSDPGAESFDEIEFKDGRLFERYSQAQRVGGQVVGRVWSFRDVTERKRLEIELRQAQRMEGIGQLAGGVAHDFNNLLTVILGNANLAMSQSDLLAETKLLLKEVSGAGERAADLTRQLLTFSRKQPMRPAPVNMNTVVVGMSGMLSRVLGEDIQLERRCIPDLPRILADAGMMEQILLNLASNARDAMPRGGRLVIQTGTARVDAAKARQHPQATEGTFVRLTVQDTGCGIAPEILPRIFEPFFTTKDVGKGTGLGLATVYGIVRQHQGWVDVASNPGEGATFNIYLPAMSQPVEAAAEGQVLEEVPGGSEGILVVEDDSALRRFVVSFLQRRGYTVFEAANGREALGVWEQNRKRVDLLLTDLVMPEGISGQELGRRLKAASPGLRIVYTSGYSMEWSPTDLRLEPGVHFLQKPYPPAVLLRTVRNCLDQPVPSRST